MVNNGIIYLNSAYTSERCIKPEEKRDFLQEDLSIPLYFLNLQPYPTSRADIVELRNRFTVES